MRNRTSRLAMLACPAGRKLHPASDPGPFLVSCAQREPLICGLGNRLARVACLSTIAFSIRERTGEGPADLSTVMTDLNKILDASVAADGFHIPQGTTGHGIIDLTKIDFEALAKRFGTSKTKNIDLEQLKAAIRSQLDTLIRLNRTRADYLMKFEELIDAYNVGSRNIDELFKELLALSRSLNDEQERHVEVVAVREGGAHESRAEARDPHAGAP